MGLTGASLNQHPLTVPRDKPSPVAEFPMRAWSMRIFILDNEGNERTADVFTKVVYNLHPTFENPVQSELNEFQPASPVL